MSDHPSDVEFAVTLALRCGSIHAYEERAMRSLISQSGLLAFEQLLKVREQGAAPETDEEAVYRRFGLSKEAVDKRLK